MSEAVAIGVGSLVMVMATAFIAAHYQREQMRRKLLTQWVAITTGGAGEEPGVALRQRDLDGAYFLLAETGYRESAER